MTSTTEGIAFAWQPDVKSADQVNGRTPAEGKKPRPAKLPNLPEEFWKARETFTRIREAAWAIGRSGDAVLAACLARTAAMTHHELLFDFGRGVGTLNFLASIVGNSGTGKTQAVSVASELHLVPSYLRDPDDPTFKFRDGVPLGTGEGIAEAYMGWTTRETSDTYKSGDRKGECKVEKVRGQVRNNVFFYLDEGETLSKMMKERQGTTVGGVIRSAWNGSTIGQQNGREETTRIVPKNNYSLGLVVGYQPDVAQDLLADGGPGTPQRFLWVSATDPNIPRLPPPRPAPYFLPLTDVLGDPIKGVMGATESIRVGLWERNLDVAHGDEEVSELDSHVDLMRCKLSCLLAVYEGRMTVTEEDWELAGVIWDTSCAVRDALVEDGARKAHEKAEKETARYVDRDVRAHLARKDVDATIVRIARRVALYVHERGPCSELEPKGKLAYRDRGHYEAALSYATSQGWIATDDGALRAGEAKPA